MNHDVEEVKVIPRISEPLQNLSKNLCPKNLPSPPLCTLRDSNGHQKGKEAPSVFWGGLEYAGLLSPTSFYTKARPEPGFRVAPTWAERRDGVGIPGLTPEIWPTPWELSPPEVARRVFSTEGFRAMPTPGKVTGVQEERHVLISPPPRIL